MFWLESFKDVKYLKNSDEIIQKLEDMKKAFNEINIKTDWKSRRITVSDSGEIRINIDALFSAK